MNRDKYNILTDEELVKMAQEGSVTAEEFLINKYKEVAKIKSSVYFIMGGDKEDVIQEGMIGIFKAIREYREDRDDGDGRDGTAGRGDGKKKTASFRTFAEICINRQIISAIRNANLKKHQILNESVSLNQESEMQETGEGQPQQAPLSERIRSGQQHDPESMVLMKEIAAFLKEDSEDLFSPLEKKVLASMLQGKKYKEIAAELGKSDKSIDNATQRIKKKIYAYLGY